MIDGPSGRHGQGFIVFVPCAKRVNVPFQLVANLGDGILDAMVFQVNPGQAQVCFVVEQRGIQTTGFQLGQKLGITQVEMCGHSLIKMKDFAHKGGVLSINKTITLCRGAACRASGFWYVYAKPAY